MTQASSEHPGHRLLASVLILVAAIPVFTFAYFWYKNATFRSRLTFLPPRTITTILRPVREADKFGHEATYWAVDVTNHSQETLYQCELTFISKGDLQKYTAFSKTYILQDCNNYPDTRRNYECRLQNAVIRWQQLIPARLWDRLPENGTLTIAVSRFYLQQTRPEQSFLSQKTLLDISSLNVSCLNPKGHLVGQNIPF